MKARTLGGIGILLLGGSLGSAALLVSAAGTSLAQSTTLSSAQTDKPIRSAQVNQSSPGLPPTVAEPPSAPTAADCDANCVRRSADTAAQACVPLIEAKAPIDYDWLSRPFGGMFTQAEQPGKDGVIRYRGDGIRVLTAQNQWLRHAYECAYDPVARKIVDVQLRPGRLVPPADVAHFIADILKKHPGAQVTTQLLGKDGKPLPPQAKVAAAKPRPRYGEPNPITIAQAHLHMPQIDSAVRVSQSVRKSKAHKRH
jgi:hypothetical protein